MNGEPDAFIIVHRPKDGSWPYGIGPFPILDGLPERIMAELECECETSTLWVAFPRGVRMVYAPGGEGTAGILAIMATLASGVDEDEPVH
jgi:hypothetical protein